MGSRRFTRLTNGFSKNLDNHVAAVMAETIGPLGNEIRCVVVDAARYLQALAPVPADNPWRGQREDRGRDLLRVMKAIALSGDH